jgi:hypothetical protein
MSILVGITSLKPRPEFLRDIQKLFDNCKDKYELEVLWVRGKKLVDAQNEIADYLLSSTHEALLMLEEDHWGHTVEMLDELVEMDSDVAAISYYSRHPHYPMTTLLNSGKSYPHCYNPIPAKDGVHEVDLCGFGMTLIKRQVIEMLDGPKFQVNKSRRLNGAPEYATDSNFCDRVKEKGLNIKASLNHDLVHDGISRSNYLEHIDKWFRDFKKNKVKDMKIVTHKQFEMKPMGPNAGDILREGIAKLAMPYWISAGTLLGLYREGDFIQGDTDLDVAVRGYQGIEEDILSDLEGFSLIRSCFYQNKPQQLAFIKDDIIFDVFIHWPEGSNLVNYSGYGKTVMDASILINAKEYDTKYGRFLFPNPTEDYLVIRYGPDWRIPKDEKPRFEKIQ